MKKWLEEYGEMLLAVTAGGMILAFILTSGILAAIGKRVDTGVNCKVEHQVFQVFEKLCQRGKPEIVCNKEKHCYAGEVVSIEEVVQGKDADGRNLAVEVKEILDHEGVSFIDEYQRDVRQVTFQKAGVYRFKVKAQDKEKLCVTRWIELPIDNRKGRE